MVVSYFSKEFYHWLAVCRNEAQRLSCTQCGSRAVPIFLILHLAKAVFLCLFFALNAKSNCFGGPSKNTQTLTFKA